MELRAVVATLLSCLVVLSSAAYPSGFDEDFCMPPLDNGGRPFPSFPNEFHAKMEWNDHVTRKSRYMGEYMSVSNNVGTVFIMGYTAPGIVTQYITQAATNELFIIYDAEPSEFQDGNCVVQSLTDKVEHVLPFRNNYKTGSSTLLSGGSLMTLGADSVGNMAYRGTEMKNGVSCDVWHGCLYIPNGQITINVKYHFSRNDWFAAGGSTSAPVSIQASGVSAIQRDFRLEQTFNYIYFSDQWPSKNPEHFASVFETPEHAYCPGRKNVLDLPAVPQQFSFRAEVIDQLNHQISYVTEWYDFNANYSRIDFKSPPTGNDSVDDTISPQTIINDFNTGVSYIIDKFTRACTVVPITGGEFDSMPLGPLKTRMRTPKEFFDFDQNDKYPWQYMGEHLVRNTAANGWISYRPYPNKDSPLNATWEWFFATKQTVIKAQDLVEDLEPMRAVVKSKEAGVDVTYNIYRFSENAPDNKVFDVRNCYIDGNSVSFDMQLQGNSTFDAKNNRKLLEYWFTLSVAEYAGVRFIRITDVEFSFYGKRIAVQFTILGPAPIKGDVDNNIIQVSLDMAKDRLVQEFIEGSFQVYLVSSADSVETTVFSPVSGSLRVIERQHTTAYRPLKQPISKEVAYHSIRGPGMDGGAAAGLGIGMILAGAALAGVGILVYKKKTGHISIPRQKLTNEKS